MKNKILLISTISIFAILTIFIATYDNTIKADVASRTTSSEKSNVHESIANCQYETSSHVNEYMSKNLITLNSSFYLKNTYTPEYLNEISDSVVIAKVISLDSSSMEYNKVVGMTYGKLLINNSIKGNLVADTVIDYAKPGGIMTLSEWESSQPKVANEKRKFIREQNEINIDTSKTYIDLKIEDDIDIEDGKTYLVYLKYSNSMKKYEIVGLENGLMEVNIAKSEGKLSVSQLDINELKIKNNHTNEYESLQQYISSNILK